MYGRRPYTLLLMKNNKNGGAPYRNAFAGMIAALSVVALLAGAVTGVLDLTGLCIASVLSAIAVVELGGRYPYLIWAVTGVISFVLLPDKSLAAGYVLFGGIYPVLKLYFERCGRALEWMLKLGYGAAVLCTLYALSRFVFNVPREARVLEVVLAVGYALFFVVYDRALSVAMTLYVTRLRGKLKFLGKLR